MTEVNQGGAAAGVQPLLEARGIVKRFGAFTALNGVDFAVAPGEIHALLGENGAGKSTLMNVLSGLLRPTEGEIRRDGTPVSFASPRDAERRGIGMVHQHFLLVPPLTVRENLLLGAAPEKGGPLSYPIEAVLDEARALADRLSWRIPWDKPAGSLPVGDQQRIEILKALRGEARILIFDEPTAVLTPTETPELFGTIRRLAGEGRGIVFISHKLDEVLGLAGQVTVLRRGQVVHRTTTGETDAEGLAEAMVGKGSEAAEMLKEGTRKVVSGDGAETNSTVTVASSQPTLTVESLTLNGVGRAARPRLYDISFAVEPGEIFGIAGVDGNGQAELAECLSGLIEPDAGRILVGAEAPPADPAAFRRAGVAVIPADRQTRGLALPMSITENVAFGVYDDPAYRWGPFLRWPRLRTRAADLIKRFDIRATGPESPTAALSGGNQQKVVIARALSSNPKVVVAVNPTRGLDVGAIAYVHSALRAAQADGAAIVLISTELDEVITLATRRIAVLYEGTFSGTVAPDVPRTRFGLLMGGESALPTAAEPALATAPVIRRLLRDGALLFLCLIAGLLLMAGIIRAVGASPIGVAQALYQGAWGSTYNRTETLAQSVPLLLTGLGVAVAFRCRLFNIGAEGQFLVGAIGATAAGLPHLLPGLQGLQLPLVLAAGAVAGALWAGIAALLKIGRGVQEVLSTLLLNFVAIQLLAWMVRGPLQERVHEYPQSDPIAVPARMALLLPRTHLHGGVLLSVAVAVLVFLYLRWTKSGFALRAVGANGEAAQAAGFSLRRTVAGAFLLSGALSGLAGAVQVSGVTYLLSDGISPGYGYTAIAVALLAGLSPLAIIPSALFFGALTAGSIAVEQTVPGVSAVVLQALQAVTLLTLMGYAWTRERFRFQVSPIVTTAAPTVGATA